MIGYVQLNPDVQEEIERLGRTWRLSPADVVDALLGVALQDNERMAYVLMRMSQERHS